MEPVLIIGPSARHLWHGDSINEHEMVNDWQNNPVFSPVPLVNVEVSRFASGESYCQIQDNIRGKDVYIIQSISAPANDSLMDLLVMADAARRASAGRLTAVIPFMGYMRQDRKDKPRVPISAKLVVDMLECAGFERIITLDVHTLQAQGFTNIPFDHLFSYPLFVGRFQNIKRYAEEEGHEVKFVSPDIGAIKRAQAYAETFGVGFAIVNKKRLSPNETKPVSLIGDVRGCSVIITDDLTETAGTLLGAAQICRDNGAVDVKLSVAHPCLTQEGAERIKRALAADLISEVITTDTVNCPYIPTYEESLNSEQFHIVSSARLFGKAIQRTNRNESITSLFEVKGY